RILPSSPATRCNDPSGQAGRAPSAAARPGLPSETWAARVSMPPARSRAARERPDLAARRGSLSKMTRRRQLVFGAAGAVVVLLLLVVAVKRNSGQSVAVQVGEVTRQTLTSVVTASGEIRPKHYVNITSQTFGKIVSIEVAEGDHVKAAQVLLRMEATQPASGRAAPRAI